MSKDLKFHEAAEAFPLLDKKQLQELADDIKANGQRVPILLLDGKIVDGRNRYLACKLAKVEPQTKQFRGDAVDLVASLNIHRRHLDESQRSMIAADLATLRRGRPKEGNGHGISDDEAAKAMNVSAGSVKRARKVKNKGIKKLQKAVRRGEVAVSAAAQLSKLPKSQQGRILKKGAKAVKAVAGEIRGPAAARGGLAAEQAQLKSAFVVAKKKMLGAYDEWRDAALKREDLSIDVALKEVRDLIETTLTL